MPGSTADRALEHGDSCPHVPRDTVAALLSPEASGPALITVGGRVDRPRQPAGSAVDRLAERLRAAGLGPGDRIAIVLPNGPEMALVLLAAMSVGCAAPLNPKYREDEFRFYLDDLGAAALVTDGSAPAAPPLAGGDCSRLAVTIVDRRAAAPAPRRSSLRVERRAGDDQPSRRPIRARPTADDEALVLHTSGTTSRPKIVPLRQRNLAGSARNIAASLRAHRSRPLADGDAALPHPRDHGRPAGTAVGRRVRGVPHRASTPSSSTAGSTTCSPTYYTAVPTMHQMVLARRPRHARTTSLRFVRSSSASLPGRCSTV